VGHSDVMLSNIDRIRTPSDAEFHSFPKARADESVFFSENFFAVQISWASNHKWVKNVELMYFLVIIGLGPGSRATGCESDYGDFRQLDSRRKTRSTHLMIHRHRTPNYEPLSLVHLQTNNLLNIKSRDFSCLGIKFLEHC
jgi:hypothetical protein